MQSVINSAEESELSRALRACRGALLGVALMSGVVNILYLSGSFFMLEIYDRVLPSRSVPTLVGLAILIGILYSFQGVLDFIRNRILVRIGASVDESLSGRIYQILIDLPLRSRQPPRGLEPIHDLDQIRTFLSGSGPTALFDLPWIPLYIFVAYLFHPVIGYVAGGGAIALFVLTAMAEMLARKPTRIAVEHGIRRSLLADASRRNAEVLRAMGFGRRLAGLWADANAKYIASHRRASDIAGGLGALSKVLRMILQSAVLGVGAYLVLRGEATAGIIIASAILTSRALAPVELAIANWKGFLTARQSWRRLAALLEGIPAAATAHPLPGPSVSLHVENVSAVPPGADKLVVHEVSFRLEKGAVLGIIGPSASGKSSLVRLIVGVWAPARGKIRLDGAALDQWHPDALGGHLGYLPQDVELFAGTVADNVARFDPAPESEAVIAAAKAAGVHDMILRLPDGYDTQIGESGAVLSAGQRQRVALARALYRDPFLVVLDEPNSNLDAEGEEALSRALDAIRARQGIAIVVAHRANALAAVDTILVLAGGRMQAFGPKDAVLAKLPRRPSPAPEPSPLKVVGDRGNPQP